jgi:hypothetical protein
MSWWSWIFGFGVKSSGTPADHKAPHDQRGDETVDESTGIGEEDGQLLDNTSIDPDMQDRDADKFHLK